MGVKASTSGKAGDREMLLKAQPRATPAWFAVGNIAKKLTTIRAAQRRRANRSSLRRLTSFESGERAWSRNPLSRSSSYVKRGIGFGESKACRRVLWPSRQKSVVRMRCGVESWPRGRKDLRKRRYSQISPSNGCDWLFNSSARKSRGMRASRIQTAVKRSHGAGFDDAK